MFSKSITARIFDFAAIKLVSSVTTRWPSIGDVVAHVTDFQHFVLTVVAQMSS